MPHKIGKALAYFAMHPDMVLGLCGRYCEASGVELKQAAEISRSKPEHLEKRFGVATVRETWFSHQHFWHCGSRRDTL